MTARIVLIERSSCSTKGGPRSSFGALMVVGNQCGRVGLRWGKSVEAADAIRKAEKSAVREMVSVPVTPLTLPREACGEFGGAKVFLRPASSGTGIIASKTVRAVLECAGVKNAVGKSLGTRNPVNVAKVTVRALLNGRLRDQREQERGLKKTPKSVFLQLPGFDKGNHDPFQLN